MSDHLAEKLVIAFVTTRREPGNTHEQTGMQRREHANRRGEDVRMKLSGSISSMTVDFPMAGIHMTSFRSGVDAEMMTWVEDETDVDSKVSHRKEQVGWVVEAGKDRGGRTVALERTSIFSGRSMLLRTVTWTSALLAIVRRALTRARWEEVDKRGRSSWKDKKRVK
jgi:hypothetical protein